MSIEDLHHEIDRAWPKHLDDTRRLLRMPSVSMTGEGIDRCASYLEDQLAKMGARHGQFKASKKSLPLVHGYLDAGAERTTLLYGMYDVQPVGDPKEWHSPPWEARIVKKKPYGEILVARGVYNSKGSLAGTLNAIKTMLDKDEMPLNIHFLMEGEEELGGRSLPEYVIKNKKLLSKADAAWGFDYSENSKGRPVVCLGMKGCVYFDLISDGKWQGGPTSEIHSSDAVWVQSPVWRLVQAISTLVDENQVPVVDGLWDGLPGPDKDDLMLIKELAKTIDMDAYKRELGIKSFKFKGSKEELLKKYLFEPSINIAGLGAGYQGEGTKTVLPPRAKAKIDIRTVPNMTIPEVHKKVMDHLRKRGFSDIRMVNYEDYPWTKVSYRERISQATIEAMKYHGRQPEVWPMVAGSAPFYLFNDVLGVPWGGSGLGHGGNAHAPNEFAVIETMKEYEKSVITMMWKFAEAA